MRSLELQDANDAFTKTIAENLKGIIDSQKAINLLNERLLSSTASMDENGNFPNTKQGRLDEQVAVSTVNLIRAFGKGAFKATKENIKDLLNIAQTVEDTKIVLEMIANGQGGDVLSGIGEALAQNLDEYQLASPERKAEMEGAFVAEALSLLVPGYGGAKLLHKTIKVMGKSAKIVSISSSLAKAVSNLGKLSKESIKNFSKVSSQILGNQRGSIQLSSSSLKRGNGFFGELGKKITSSSLNPEQLKNYPRFKKKGGQNIIVRDIGDEKIVFSRTIKGKVPGSKAVYEKIVDKNGNTIKMTKTTYDNNGNIVHIKDKA